MSRKEWEALDPTFTSRPVEVPSWIVAIGQAGQYSCFTQEACTYYVKQIQKQHMRNTTSQRNDIGYNFLIGGDGRVYEGRNWTTEAAFGISKASVKKTVLLS